MVKRAARDAAAREKYAVAATAFAEKEAEEKRQQLERARAVEHAAKLYSEGKTMEEIAAETGVSAGRLMCWMLADLGPEMDRLRETAVITKAVENLAKLEAAGTYIEVMRAGQLVKHWNWMLERLVRSRFGPSLDVNATVKVELPDAAETARRMAFLLARGTEIEGVATVVPESVGDVDDEHRLDG